MTLRKVLNDVQVERYLNTDSVMSVEGDWTIKSYARGSEIVKRDGIMAKDEKELILIDTNSGWRCGRHPTTRLCLDYVMEEV